jgi:hypothetical protein
VSALLTILGLGVAVTLLVLFKPLLSGLFHAAAMAFRPKLSKDERLSRSHMRDTLMLQRMLNATDGASSHAAELRAMASRA